MSAIRSPGFMLGRSARPKTEHPAEKVETMRDTQKAHVENFLEMLAVEHGVTKQTRSLYHGVLRVFAAFMVSRGRGVEDVQAEDIQAYLKDVIAAGQAPSTVNRRVSTLRQFYRFLFAAGLRDDDPVAVIDGSRPRPVLPKELAGLLTTWLTYLRTERHYSPHTLDAYERDVGRFLEFMSEQVDISDLPDFLVIPLAGLRSYLAAQSDKARSSIDRGFHAVRSFDRWLGRRGVWQ